MNNVLSSSLFFGVTVSLLTYWIGMLLKKRFRSPLFNPLLISVVLTICSLGTRVALAYLLSAIPSVGVTGIWLSIPIGWFLADTVGFLLWRRERQKLVYFE